MFYCFVHNWYSTDAACPICHPVITTTETNMIINPKEEIKSNDSFQWTDSLVGAYANFVQDNVRPGEAVFHSTMIERFKESKKPKPQAENKPDWEIVESTRRYFHNNDPLHGHETIIKKVKRLSDGEVFSVGDEVRIERHLYEGEKMKILLFKKETPGMCALLDPPLHPKWDKNINAWNIAWLKKLPPQPQKLFTTEDGVRLQSGDIGREIYFITNHWEAKYWKVTEDFKPLEGVKYFYRKEAAEKYIAENKPLTLSCQTTNKNNPK